MKEENLAANISKQTVGLTQESGYTDPCDNPTVSMIVIFYCCTQLFSSLSEVGNFLNTLPTVDYFLHYICA